MLKIIDLANEQRGAYDQFIDRAPTGLPQHLSGWQDVLAQTYGYKTRFLTAVKDQAIVGAMPLFLIDSPLLGRTVRTMPGGLVASNDTIAAALIDEAKRWTAVSGASRLLIADGRCTWRDETLQCSSDHVTWTKDLRAGEAAVWQQLHANIRRQVRLARKNDLTVQIRRDAKAIQPFYKLFLQFTHKNGTPLFGLNFLENVVAAFPERFSIALVYRYERPLGGYFQLECGDAVVGLWGASLHQFLKLRPVYLAYWEIMREAMRHEFNTLDMGRSPINANTSRFKGQWGGVSTPIYQLSTSSPDRTKRPPPAEPTEKFRLVRRCWPYLPEPVAKYLGPKLRKHMPFA